MSRGFGATPWGRAWVEALEGASELDPVRLARGRTYARQGHVSRIEIEAGRVTALVRGNRALPYRVALEVPTFDDDTWMRVASAIAQRSGRAAALLDGELDPEIVTVAAAAGAPLLPAAGHVAPRCSCPDWAELCKHAAAVAYLVADALDEDPFAVFALRGIGRTDLMDRVRAARSASAEPNDRRPGKEAASGPPPLGTGPGGAGRMVSSTFGGGAVVDPGVIARDSWASDRSTPPGRRDLPSEPGSPSGWPIDPPRDAPFTGDGLRELATDAARRAWAQLADGEPSHLALAEQADIARRAAAKLDRLDSLPDFARRTGIAPGQLMHQALAWRNAGPEGLEVIDEALWRPSDAVLQRGIDAFDEAGIDPEEIQIRSNRLTFGDIQLRVSSDGRWWRYERRGRTWELVEPPAGDPTDLISS